MSHTTIAMSAGSVTGMMATAGYVAGLCCPDCVEIVTGNITMSPTGALAASVVTPSVSRL